MTSEAGELGRTDVCSGVWYVLQTKPHAEDAVERRLGSPGVAVFLPRIVATVRAGRYRQKRILPMFPGYLFIHTNLADGGVRIRYTPGVRDFLRSPEHEAQSVSPAIVDAIRERIGSSGVYDPPPPRFAPGERLRIDDGPLRGIDVIFEREISGPERVAVLLAAVSLPARVVLSSRQLAPC